MRRRLFTLGRTDVVLHPATLLFWLYMVLAGQGGLLVCGMVSILLHEMGHGVAAAALGHPPEELELTPLGCLMRQEEDAETPRWQRLVVVLAGPGVTALLCIASVYLTAYGWLDRSLGRLLFSCNAAILCVNALPALPLDGGRLLSLGLGLVVREETVRRVMRALGTALGAVLVTLNCVVCVRYGGWNLSLACAGCFLMYAAVMGTTSAALVELQGFMARKARLELRGSLRTCHITVIDTLPLRRVVRLLHPNYRTMLLVVKQGTGQQLAVVGEEQLIERYLETPGETCRIFGKNDD